MRPLSLTPAARAARNAALLSRADAGSSAAATVALYSAAGGTLLGTRTLAKPCGNVNAAGRIELAADTAVTDLVLATGAATWATWVAADGVVLGEGQVTDTTGFAGAVGAATDTGDIGPWVLAGTSGTQLYEGGIVALTSAVLG